jgi:NosR/NirI family nitrous oxide reductase transcriptional regulator
MQSELTINSTKDPKLAIKAGWNQWLVGISILAVAAAWLVGYFTSGSDVAPFVTNVIPTAVKIEKRGDLYVGLAGDGEQIVGYAAIGQAPGYGGPIEMLVGMDPDGKITGVRIVQQRETPGFFRLVESQGLLEQFLHKSVSDPLVLGQDLDAVSGATFSAEGVAAAARQAVNQIAAQGLGVTRPPEQHPIQFGIPEIALVLLYAAGYWGHRQRNGALKRGVRWGTMLAGMVIVGFVYTLPLTIAQVITFLSGFWPDWHSHLYWYMLIGGILFVTTVDAKNPYCSWFCPFGAVQECLAKMSGAKYYRPRRFSDLLTWIQRGLALAAIVLGLALRRPGIAGYEPFATLFDLRGTAVQWIFLVVIILVSLLVYRPFCNYLCPLDPVVDFIGEIRRQARSFRKKHEKIK